MSGSDSEFAQVEVLPAEYADRILSARSYQRALHICTLEPLILVGLLALGLLGGFLHKASVEESNQTKFTLAIVAYGLGVLAVPIAILFRSPNKWLQRAARCEVNRRTNKIVNPDAPGVRFVEIVPKSNWDDTTLFENATDVGFLAIDLQKGFLFYEGDNERYRIPAKAIVKCEQDSYTRLIQSPYTKAPSNMTIFYHFVVVTMKVSEQMTVEVPFRIRRRVSLWSDQKARNANYEFLREINRLKPTFKITT
jgi:hypothetical protein